MYVEKKDAGRERTEMNYLTGKCLCQSLTWLQRWPQTAADPATMENFQFKSSAMWSWGPHLNLSQNFGQLGGDVVIPYRGMACGLCEGFP